MKELFSPRWFKSRASESLPDEALRRNIERATETALKKRADVVGAFPEWESYRTAARAVKEHVLENLSSYLASFEEHARANGSTVLYARDGVEACALVMDIVLSAGTRTVVKSKSMTSEEIGLSAALGRSGIQAVETDLGEYIVQLAGEPPSHITAPALHKSRRDIGRLFEQKLGLPYSDEPETLTAVARSVLRDRFFEAGVGISGVNFGLADSGAICVVENEGNARMATTLPPVHIALMGVEKLLPDMRCLALFLDMLARSATGQRLSSYTSIIRGPKRADEWDGPDVLYIIILDNGRTDIFADSRFRSVLSCIRCGACLNVCPVYRVVGGHAYGSAYPGPIGAVLAPFFHGKEDGRHLPYASSLCGACAEICPVRIDIPRLLLLHRGETVRERRAPLIERFLMKAYACVVKRPALYALTGHLLRAFAPLATDEHGLLRIPTRAKTRTFPAPAEKTFREIWKEEGIGST
ncbi:MAG: LutB/LldF family L-lactate oxidation iron-sulfur protein [Bacteroidota bacterium]|nr:LutB/LldF family L-lactate oxidation iron-sulfur protein [Bacteroidota bacterium]